MLLELAVSGLGVIDDLALVPAKGLTALTGETGAGKTLVVEALDLLLGGRADPMLVGPGQNEATVEGRFLVDDAELVLTRVVPADGRSRAYVNGRMATAGTLAEMGEGLVDLYGQHGHQSLLRAPVQRDALDRFGRVDLEPLDTARQERAATDAALAGLGGDHGAREREADLLRFQLAELDGAGLDDPAEEARLDAEEDLLADAVAHREAAAEASTALSADGAAADAIGVGIGALHGRTPFTDLVTRLGGVQAELSDIAAELRAAAEAIDDDPRRLDEVRERRQLLRDLVRKYATAAPVDPRSSGRAAEPADTLAAVLTYREAVRDRLDLLERHDASAAAMEARRSDQDKVVRAAERAVRSARQQAAPRLAAAVENHLRELAMAQARIEVAVGERGAGDDVAFHLAANPGSSLLPLAKAASGGELARAMLALRLVLTSSTPATLVFDEVDAGIGGQAALAVGRALADLAAGRQVLVVTHLPQVAAFADTQVVVSKHLTGASTASKADVVQGGDRLVELSRMLSGSPGSEVAREHAAELLTVASRERSR